MLLHSRDAYAEPFRYVLGRHLVEASHYHDPPRLWGKLLDRGDQPPQFVAIGQLAQSVDAQVRLLQVLHGSDALERDDARAADPLDAEIADDLQYIGPRIGRLPRALVGEHPGIGVVHEIGGFIEIAGELSRQLQILPLIRQDLVDEPMIELLSHIIEITTRLGRVLGLAFPFL
jgi:hypothetical protein